MDYKKKFEDFLDKMQGLLNSAKKQGHIIVRVEDIENTFPELQESEDERIRTAILNHLKKMWGNCKDDICGVHVEDAIAWLEKQGEKPKEVTCTHEVETGNGNIKALVTEKILLPKFKVGDWITNGDYTWKVTQVEQFDYILQSQNGNVVDDTISHVDEQFHLWRLKDAKDGDILATSTGAFIYNGNNGGGCCPGCYCGIDTLGNFKTGTKHHWTTKPVFPATKEQRDALMKIMDDAGYTFDFEKKELKKIPNALEECEIERIEHGKYYYCIKDYYSGGNKRASKGDVVQALNGMSMMALGVKANEYFMPVKKIRQKTIWNAEDEKNLNVVLSFIGDEYLRRWLKDIIHKKYDE